LRELAEEREKLREELRQARSDDALPQLPSPPTGEPGLPSNTPPPPSPPRQGSMSTIRELSMEGYPDQVVQTIMQRYRLRVTIKMIQGGTNQKFLSSAANNSGDHFYANAGGAPGLYQVFELSTDAVAKMSHLEEEAIRERGMEPAVTHVKRIKFGIVQTKDGYDLGVLEFEAEPV
jgi:hypothetical protein